MTSPSFHVVIPCAGSGSRSGSLTVPKQYRCVLGRPMILHTLDAFVSVPAIDRMVLVVSPDDAYELDLPAQVERVACGGLTRAQSVLAGLHHLRETGASDHDWVLVHDAARSDTRKHRYWDLHRKRLSRRLTTRLQNQTHPEQPQKGIKTHPRWF